MALTTSLVTGSVATLLGALYQQRDRLYFHPDLDLKTSPRQALGLQYENVNIFYTKSSVVKMIHGWWIPSVSVNKYDENHYVILHCHGNAGNIGHRIPFVQYVRRFLPQCSLLLFDYRGFGNSGSPDIRPTVTSCHDSTWHAFIWLIDKGIPSEKIILWGESIGTAFATELAAKLNVPIAGLVLQSPFTNITGMIKHIHPKVTAFIPDFVLPNDLDNVRNLKILYEKQMSCPVVMFHSPIDEVIPYEMSVELRPFVTAYADLSGGHNDGLLSEHHIDYFIRRFLKLNR